MNKLIKPAGAALEADPEPALVPLWLTWKLSRTNRLPAALKIRYRGWVGYLLFPFDLVLMPALPAK
jgi:hypothetical protein